MRNSNDIVVFGPLPELKAVLRCKDEAWDCDSMEDAYARCKFLTAIGMEPEVIPLFPGQCMGCEFHICDNTVCSLSTRNGKSGCHFFSIREYN